MLEPFSLAGCAIKIQYGSQRIFAQDGERLLDTLLSAGIDHRHICGGRGFCTSCRVEILAGGEGLSPVSPLERERLGADAGRLRLACQAVVRGKVHARVPAPRAARFSPFGDDDVKAHGRAD